MQVVNCTTPANYFHVLRRQVRRDFRKPLIVMTPKSLLRHKAVVSDLADMGPGTSFHRVLDEKDTEVKHGKAKRIVMCSGKVYYDLAAARDEAKAWDIEILDMHHRHKVDAPSGTALMLAEAAAEGRGVSLDEVADRGRDGLTGPREHGAIGIAALRGGSVVGDHQLILAGPNERLVLSHHAESRDIFAQGALQAALWGGDKSPGLYAMSDVLGL